MGSDDPESGESLRGCNENPDEPFDVVNLFLAALQHCSTVGGILYHLLPTPQHLLHMSVLYVIEYDKNRGVMITKLRESAALCQESPAELSILDPSEGRV